MVNKILKKADSKDLPFQKVDQDYNYSEEEKSTLDSLSLQSLSSTNSADGKAFRKPKYKTKKSNKLSTLIEEVSELSSDVQSEDDQDKNNPNREGAVLRHGNTVLEIKP